MTIMKLSLAEFINYAADRRIDIKKITKTYVYVEDVPLPINLPQSLPYKIDFNWSIEWGGTQQTLYQSVLEDKRIMSIKTVRQYLNLGLRESKEIVDMNWENWRRIAALRDQEERRNNAITT